jgi:hypothetical protein
MNTFWNIRLNFAFLGSVSMNWVTQKRVAAAWIFVLEWLARSKTPQSVARRDGM